MSAKYLHIVSFNIPYPADYGGVIDIFYKLKALKIAGVQIILHCFEYGRHHSKELEDLCFKVHYYPRKSGLKYFFMSDPYIVTTRRSNTMPRYLFGDSFPVLFEGLHSTDILRRCKEAHKNTMIRAHNIEHLYYLALSKSERNIFRKFFLRTESRKLKRYEKIMQYADHILGIAKHETSYFANKYGEALFLPAFHRFDEVTSLPGNGDYILFHGNLSVPENSEVIMKLARGPLSKIKVPVVVAGKNPSKRLRNKLARYPQVSLIDNPSDDAMDQLIRNAHVNLLYTYQATGIKLKLLHALFAGRHCLVNSEMVKGTGLNHLCAITNTNDELVQVLHDLMRFPFDEKSVTERKNALKEFSNRAGAEKILRIIS